MFKIVNAPDLACFSFQNWFNSSKQNDQTYRFTKDGIKFVQQKGNAKKI